MCLGPVGGDAAEPNAGIGMHAETGSSVYRNDDGLRVISPWASVRQHVGEPTEIGASWKADIISAATVDVVSAATMRFDETRQEGSLSVNHAWRDLRLSGAYTGSTESDTRNHWLALGGDLDLIDRNVTAHLGYGLGLDRLGSGRESDELWRDRTVHQIDASVLQVLGPATTASAAYSLQLVRGFQSSVYRHVPLLPSDPSLWRRSYAQWVPERHPDSRDRHAFSLQARHAFSPRFFGHASWRGYLDTWSMRAHTAELGVGVDLGGGWLIELANRGHRQSRVSFYRSVYTVNRDYLTRDRRLGEMWSDITRLDLRWLHGRWQALLRGEAHWTRYADFQAVVGELLEPMPDTWALVVQAAIAIEL